MQSRQLPAEQRKSGEDKQKPSPSTHAFKPDKPWTMYLISLQLGVLGYTWVQEALGSEDPVRTECLAECLPLVNATFPRCINRGRHPAEAQLL